MIVGDNFLNLVDFRKTPIDSEFEEGEFAHLECLATIREALMSWEKDGQPLRNKKHITMLKNGYIFMDKVELNDAGEYTCIAQDLTTGCTKRVSAKLNVAAKAKIEDSKYYKIFFSVVLRRFIMVVL